MISLKKSIAVLLNLNGDVLGSNLKKCDFVKKCSHYTNVQLYSLLKNLPFHSCRLLLVVDGCSCGQTFLSVGLQPTTCTTGTTPSKSTKTRAFRCVCFQTCTRERRLSTLLLWEG